MLPGARGLYTVSAFAQLSREAAAAALFAYLLAPFRCNPAAVATAVAVRPCCCCFHVESVQLMEGLPHALAGAEATVAVTALVDATEALPGVRASKAGRLPASVTVALLGAD